MVELDNLEMEYSEQGKIVSVDSVLSVEGGFVVVKAENQYDCAGCSASGGGTASLSSLFAPSVERSLWVENSLNAKVGDRVLLSLVEP